MKTIAQAQLDNAATYRCIEPRCTAMTERAYAAGVRSNALFGL